MHLLHGNLESGAKGHFIRLMDPEAWYQTQQEQWTQQVHSNIDNAARRLFEWCYGVVCGGVRSLHSARQRENNRDYMYTYGMVVGLSPCGASSSYKTWTATLPATQRRDSEGWRQW